jgi:NAD(P)-dependent dehydrogenase (short-subunit alcohol dehydrogenase family)
MKSRFVCYLLFLFMADVFGYRSCLKSFDAFGTRLFSAQNVAGKSSVLVTGATGTLGSGLVHRLNSYGFHTIGTYKDNEKLSSVWKTDPTVSFQYMDLTSNITFPESLIDPDRNEFVLINNAAVFMPGSRIDPLVESLKINTLAPMKLISETVNFLMAAENNFYKKVTIINISSGEGEKSYINSVFVKKLRECTSPALLRELIYDIMVKFDPALEYAHGPAPMYSLSKAFLNHATVLFHQVFQEKNLYPRYKIFSCCPGNFPSQMSTEEEMKKTGTVSDAVDSILQLIVERDRFESGKFYRHGKKIPF